MIEKRKKKEASQLFSIKFELSICIITFVQNSLIMSITTGISLTLHTRTHGKNRDFVECVCVCVFDAPLLKLTGLDWLLLLHRINSRYYLKLLYVSNQRDNFFVYKEYIYIHIAILCAIDSFLISLYILLYHIW